jgi:hypothetical protein
MPSSKSLYFYPIWYVSLPSSVLFNDNISCYGYIARVKDDGMLMENLRNGKGRGNPKQWVENLSQHHHSLPFSTYKTELLPSLWHGRQVTA